MLCFYVQACQWTVRDRPVFLAHDSSRFTQPSYIHIHIHIHTHRRRIPLISSSRANGMKSSAVRTPLFAHAATVPSHAHTITTGQQCTSCRKPHTPARVRAPGIFAPGCVIAAPLSLSLSLDDAAASHSDGGTSAWPLAAQE